jgi:hypothetical protein
MRHINPVRESGPLPSYDGPYTMEDIRRLYLNTTISRERHPVSTDVDEIMRRVPGITRKEAEHITTLGLSPDEEVDFAYIAYNIGLDVFYPSNQMYVARQVVTNAKGEKVEVYWNSQAFEDLSLLCVGFAPVMEYVDYHWEIFLWGDPPIHPLCDFDLCAPGTWFEYECEWGGEMNMLEDQVNLPEDAREFPSPRHPNARAELFRPQEKLALLQEMEDPEWFPRGTEQNVYRQPDFHSSS